MRRKVLLSIFAVLLCSLLAAASYGQEQKKNVQRITIKGTIGYHQNYGGYTVRQDPVGELFIVNQDQDRALLKSLMDSKRKVTIEGYLTIGADHLMIEKIEGKKFGKTK